jgi:hypothetical protein
MPVPPEATGVDRDGDPTLLWLTSPMGIDPENAGPLAPIPQICLSYRNPFAPPATIRYLLPARGGVRVNIVDVAGRPVRHVFRGDQPAGEHELVWDGRDDGGQRVAGGVYFLEVRGTRGPAARSKLVLLR